MVGLGHGPLCRVGPLRKCTPEEVIISAPTPTMPVLNNYRTVNLHTWLNGDSNQYYAVKDLDSAAGARWTIKTKMATIQGGSPDPELVVTHRVFALNDPSGDLAGSRWFGEIRHPFYQVSPTGPKRHVVFQPPSISTPQNGLNWQTIGPGGGAAVYNPVQLPYNPINCSMALHLPDLSMIGQTTAAQAGSPATF